MKLEIANKTKKQLYYVYLYKTQTKDDQSQLEDFFVKLLWTGSKF